MLKNLWVKRGLKVICVIIVLVAVLHSISFAGNDVTNVNTEDSIKQTIESYIAAQLESVKYHDADKMNILNDLIDQETEMGKKTYCYETEKTKFIIESQKVDGTIIEDYNFIIDYNELTIKGKDAVAKLKINTNIKYNFMEDIFDDSTYHEILLHLNNDKWLITDDSYMDDFKAVYGENTNFNLLIENVINNYENFMTESQKLKTEKTEEYENPQPEKIIIVNGVPGDYIENYTSSKREDAVSYAVTYTEDTADNTTDTYNNDQFKNFPKKDCQNYVSQCLWSGFGGTDTSTVTYPMTNDWYCNTSKSSTKWTSASAFKSYIISNEKSSKYGIHGKSYAAPDKTAIGDYVYMPGHVMFITKVDDTNGNDATDFSEIYISAHTSNRLDKNLKALYKGVSSPPGDMEFVKILHFKWNNDM